MTIKHFLTVFLVLIINVAAIGQDSLTYNNHIDKALEFYNSKNYKDASIQYYLAFEKIDGKAYDTDRYNAACSYALAGNIDTSFYHIYRLINNSLYRDMSQISSDSDLKTLHKDKRWAEAMFLIKHNKFNAEKNYNWKLVTLLDSIYNEDQKYRYQIDSITKEFGNQSKEMTEHWKLINYKDSLNLIEIIKILDTKGWLSKDIVGEIGNSTLFLVIQHADLETQIKYLPMMREAVIEGRAFGGDLALLEDRVAMRQGQKQIYGSQITSNYKTGELYVYPIEDPDNVNTKRASVGLGTIEEYLLNWDLIWDVEEHKKRK